MAAVMLSGCSYLSERNGKYFLIDEKGERVSDKSYSSVVYAFEGRDYIGVTVERETFLLSGNYETLYGVVDASGEWIFKPVEEKLYFRLDGLVEDTSTGDLYDGSGLFLSPRKGDAEIRSFSENGLACVKGDDGLYGYIDRDYNYVIEKQFVGASAFFENGLATVTTTENKQGYINANGEFVIPPKYQDVGLFSDGLVDVRDEDGKYYYYDEEGNLAIDQPYDFAYGFDDGVARVRIDDHYYAIDKQGNVITETTERDPLGEYMPDFDGLVIDSDNNGLIGAIDISGIQVIPYEYTSIEKADDNGNMIVGKDGLYGIVDRNNNPLVPIKYDVIVSADACGMFKVKDNTGLWGYLNPQGEEVTSCRFEEAEAFSANGLALVREKDGLYGYIDTTGNWRIEPVYSDATVFNSKLGVAAVCMEQD